MLTRTMEILFFFYMSNDPDPAAGATSEWVGLKWAAPTKGKSSPNWKSFLVGAEDGMSLMYLLKKGKQARQLEAEVGVGADPPPALKPMAALSVKGTIMNEWPLYRNHNQVGFNRVKILGGPLKWWAGKQKHVSDRRLLGPPSISRCKHRPPHRKACSQ